MVSNITKNYLELLKGASKLETLKHGPRKTIKRK